MSLFYVLASYLSHQVLPKMAKLQGDQEPAIRTNTTYCLAKIAPHLSGGVRDKVLVSAFSRALHDNFPPARVAGLSAFVATLEFHLPAVCATRILPSVAPFAVDGSKDVREACLRCLAALLGKLQKFSAEMGELDDSASSPSNANSARGSDSGASYGNGNAQSSQTSQPSASGNSGSGSMGFRLLDAVTNVAVTAIKNKVLGDDNLTSSNGASHARNSSTTGMSGNNGSMSIGNGNQQQQPRPKKTGLQGEVPDKIKPTLKDSSVYTNTSASSAGKSKHVRKSSDDDGMSDAKDSKSGGGLKENDDFFASFGDDLKDSEPVAVLALGKKQPGSGSKKPSSIGALFGTCPRAPCSHFVS